MLSTSLIDMLHVDSGPQAKKDIEKQAPSLSVSCFLIAWMML